MHEEDMNTLYVVWKSLKNISDNFLVLFATFEQQKEKNYEDIHEMDNNLYEICETIYKIVERSAISEIILV